MLRCCFCEFTNERKHRLRKHMLEEHQQELHTQDAHSKQRRCRLCAKNFENAQQRYAHELIYHSDSSKEGEMAVMVKTSLDTYRCSKCLAEFKEWKILRSHINGNHTPSKCRFCEAKFDTHESRRQHEVTHRLPKTAGNFLETI